MVVGSAMYVHGRKCWFCGSYGLSRLADKRVKCKRCRKKYSLRKLRTDLNVLYYFYLEVSARKCAHELVLNYKTVSKRYAKFRKAIIEYSEQEFKKLRGLVEADESYFGGKRKGNRVKHSKTFGKGHNHINGIEGFWSFAKERFHKYHGINRKNYPEYVKEMEFRYNHRNEQLYPLLVGVIRQFSPKNT